MSMRTGHMAGSPRTTARTRMPVLQPASRQTQRCARWRRDGEARSPSTDRCSPRPRQASPRARARPLKPVPSSTGFSPRSGCWLSSGLPPRRAPRPAFAAAFVGWNPLLAVHFAGGGHNDVWTAVFLTGALALAARGRASLSGASWALAAGLKWAPVALLPLSLLARRRDALRTGAWFAAVAVAIAAVPSSCSGRPGSRLSFRSPTGTRPMRFPRDSARLACPAGWRWSRSSSRCPGSSVARYEDDRGLVSHRS